MGRQKDSKVARKYGLPVEVLREGLPKALHEAPDDEVRPGNLIRVSTASGLQQALAEAELEKGTVRVFIAPYTAPLEAHGIAVLLGMDTEEEDEETVIRQNLGIDVEKDGGLAEGGTPGPRAAAGGGRRGPTPVARGGCGVVIANPHVLWAKKLALLAIRGEEANIARMRDHLLGQPKLYPHEVTQFPVTEENLGLCAAKDLPRLKETYLAARISSGPQVALNILRQIDRVLYKSLFKPQGNPLTEEEKHAMITDLANDYKAKHNLQGGALNASTVARQLLGVISLADFEDRKKVIIKDNMMIGERTSILKRLKRERKKFLKLEKKESLIGAAFPNFKEL